MAWLAAEVALLSRSVDLEAEGGFDYPPTAGALGAGGSGSGGPAVGLHVIAMHQGRLDLRHTRVAGCGQAGRVGRYCVHLHLLGGGADAASGGGAGRKVGGGTTLRTPSEVVGNAVEDGWNAGITVSLNNRDSYREKDL